MSVRSLTPFSQTEMQKGSAYSNARRIWKKSKEILSGEATTLKPASKPRTGYKSCSVKSENTSIDAIVTSTPSQKKVFAKKSVIEKSSSVGDKQQSSSAKDSPNFNAKKFLEERGAYKKSDQNRPKNTSKKTVKSDASGTLGGFRIDKKSRNAS